MNSNSNAKKPMGPTVLYAVGIVLVLAAVIKGAVGFYQSEIPMLVILAGGGAAALFAAQKWGERA